MINEEIILFGIFSILTYNTELSLPKILMLFFWYVMTFVVTEMVNTLEYEVRTNNFVNLLSTKTSIIEIYFKRSVIWILNSVLYFLFSALFFLKHIQFSGCDMRRGLIFSGFMLVLIYIIYFIFLCITIIFERSSTFVAFFNSIVLIFGVNIPLVKDLYHYILGQSIFFSYLYMQFLLLFVFLIIFKKYMTFKIFK